jgi:hypothetical protein
MMNEKHDQKKSVLLWCYTTATEKKGGGAKTRSGNGGTKYEQHMEEHSAVDEIYKQLQEKLFTKEVTCMGQYGASRILEIPR